MVEMTSCENHLYLPTVTAEPWLLRLRRECHAYGLKTSVSHLQTNYFSHLVKTWAIRVFADKVRRQTIPELVCEKNDENVNDRTLAQISDFNRNSTGAEVVKQESKISRTRYTWPVCRRLQRWSVPYKKFWHFHYENFTSLTPKKLAGISYSNLKVGILSSNLFNTTKHWNFEWNIQN